MSKIVRKMDKFRKGIICDIVSHLQAHRNTRVSSCDVARLSLDKLYDLAMALKKTEEAQRLPKIYGLSCETIRRHRRHEDGTPYTSNKIILYDDAGIVATLYKSSRRDSERADVAAVLPASAYEDEETKRNVCDISKKLLGAEPQNLFYLKR